jgi:hypothetical protein
LSQYKQEPSCNYKLIRAEVVEIQDLIVSSSISIQNSAKLILTITLSNDLLAETKAIFKISAYFHNWTQKNDQDTFFSNDQ